VGLIFEDSEAFQCLRWGRGQNSVEFRNWTCSI